MYYIGQAKYIVLVALLALFFPTVGQRESLSNELYHRSADAADRDGNTAEDEQIPAPYGPCHLLKGVTQREVALSALPCAARQLMPPPHTRYFSRLRPTAVIISSITPLFHALQVFRL